MTPATTTPMKGKKGDKKSGVFVVSPTTNPSTPVVTVTLGNVSYEALLDSGSCVSLIEDGILKNLPKETYKILEESGGSNKK
jgi:hypothetical protein